MLLLSKSRLLGQIRCLRRDFVQEETHDPIQYDYYNEKSRIKSRTNYIQDFITNDEFGMIEIFTEKEKDFTMSEVDIGNHQKVTIVEKERGVITSEVDRDDHESQSESETQSQDLVDDETRIQVIVSYNAFLFFTPLLTILLSHYLYEYQNTFKQI
jgi:hypothetical protein